MLDRLCHIHALVHEAPFRHERLWDNMVDTVATYGMHHLLATGLVSLSQPACMHMPAIYNYTGHLPLPTPAM